MRAGAGVSTGRLTQVSVVAADTYAKCGTPNERSELMRKLSKKWLLALVPPVALAAVGIAVSAWSTSGSGTGYAKAGTASSLTLADASASTAADLYPGGSGAVKIKVTNPNSFPVKVTSVTRSATGSITSDKGAACDASTGVTFTDQTGLTLTLAAGATGTFSLAGAASMSNSSDNSCQGAIFSIPVDVTAVSNA